MYGIFFFFFNRHVWRVYHGNNKIILSLFNDIILEKKKNLALSEINGITLVIFASYPMKFRSPVSLT